VRERAGERGRERERERERGREREREREREKYIGNKLPTALVWYQAHLRLELNNTKIFNTPRVKA
jgi:hypothetical protein